MPFFQVHSGRAVGSTAAMGVLNYRASITSILRSMIKAQGSSIPSLLLCLLASLCLLFTVPFCLCCENKKKSADDKDQDQVEIVKTATGIQITIEEAKEISLTSSDTTSGKTGSAKFGARAKARRPMHPRPTVNPKSKISAPAKPQSIKLKLQEKKSEMRSRSHSQHLKLKRLDNLKSPSKRVILSKNQPSGNASRKDLSKLGRKR